MPKILKKSLKTRDRFIAIANLQDDKESVLFQTGNRQLSPGGRGNFNGRVTVVPFDV